MSLTYRERPAQGEPTGLLVLHHGRGADEQDLLPLANALDPHRHLHIVTPRAPLTLPGWPGYHWYKVPRVGHPDPASFHAARRALAELHDALWERTGLTPAKTVLGGFSMGAVMSYALGLSEDRPAPAGVLALSGFIPTVAGWGASLADRPEVRAFIAHGRQDPVIGIDFARQARAGLTAGGLHEITYHESDLGHRIDPAHVRLALDWLESLFPAASEA